MVKVIEGVVEQWHEFFSYYGHYPCPVLMCLFHPFLCVESCISDKFADGFVQCFHVAQFDEESAHTGFSSREVADIQFVGFETIKELLRRFLECLLCPVCLCLDILDILAEEIRVGSHLGKFLALGLIKVAEDGASECLEWSDDVPSLVVLDIVVNIVENPFHHIVVHSQRRYQFIHCHVLHLIVVEFYFQVGGEVEFTCQVAHHALEERVDGLHLEVAVVVEQQVESRGSPFPCLLGVDGQGAAHGVEIVVRVAECVCNAI